MVLQLWLLGARRSCSCLSSDTSSNATASLSLFDLYFNVVNFSPLKQAWHRTFRRFCETTEYLMMGLELFQKSKYVYSL